MRREARCCVMEMPAVGYLLGWLWLMAGVGIGVGVGMAGVGELFQLFRLLNFPTV